jgi:hypothetical protein
MADIPSPDAGQCNAKKREVSQRHVTRKTAAGQRCWRKETYDITSSRLPNSDAVPAYVLHTDFTNVYQYSLH